MQAILFDLYETLVAHFDSEWTPPPQSIAQRLGLDENTFVELWSGFDATWQAGHISGYAEALTQVRVAAGREPDSHVLAQLSKEYQQTTARVFEQVEPDMLAMVSALKQSGLRLGIVTNAGDLDTAPWFDCCLAPLFDDFLASHHVGLLKRDKSIFHLACQRLGVSPKSTIFVGDGGGNELQAATEAGLTVYWCKWYLDRWPKGSRPNGFSGDEWRQSITDSRPPFERLRRPIDLLNIVNKQSWETEHCQRSRLWNRKARCS